MKRFLMLVEVAAVAGAMYVAASPASQQSSGPTAKPFKALKAQVATLSKNLKSTKLEADVALGIIADCYLTVGTSTANTNGLGVSQFGNSTTGYLFITGGSVNDKGPEKPGAQYVEMANATHTVIAELKGIPNEPLTFTIRMSTYYRLGKNGA